MIQFQDAHLTVFQSALYQTTSTVFENEDLVLIVDPNWLQEEVYQIRDYVAMNKGMRPVYLLFTHSDYDHILGYSIFPEATTIASQAFVDKQGKDKIVKDIQDFDERFYLKRDYPLVYPSIDIIISKEEEVLEIGSTKLQFYLAPGHTDCGLFTLIASQGIFIAGDYLSDVEFPFVYDDFKRYKATLLKVQSIFDQFPISTLIPGHGSVTKDQSAMNDRIQWSFEYLDELFDHLENESDFDLAKWFARYPFRKGLEKPHEENITLLKQILSKK